MVFLYKDVICYVGYGVQAGFKILEGFELFYFVIVIEWLFVEDVIIIGWVNCDEFVMGFFNEIFYFGFVCNVVDLECVFGGFFGGFVVVV